MSDVGGRRYDEEILELLSGEEMDIDFLLDENEGESEKVAELADLSEKSRSLATPQLLANQSEISRSLAVPSSLLSNMSSVSHNLANVGALPQCNQRHARPVAPVAIAEIDDASTVDDASGSRKSRKKVPKSESEIQAKLEIRRFKNRQAAERMRKRRSEETASLKNRVQELEAQLHKLEARLEASEVHNQKLQAILSSSLDPQRLPVAVPSDQLDLPAPKQEPENEAAEIYHTNFVAPILAQNYSQNNHAASVVPSPTTAISKSSSFRHLPSSSNSTQSTSHVFIF
mmetsp:Transcript_23217/g.30057  ORF Transcript_23217/g.30057 Transcript_23217/m.30057 type:complete len:287 (+) Transcript_23217:44-904(+)